MLCPNCKQQNEEGCGFCVSCGNRLPPPQLERFCSECGAERLADAVFCPQCGTAFGVAVPQAVSAPPVQSPQQVVHQPVRQPLPAAQPKSANGLKFAVAFVSACLVLTLAAFGAWLWLKPPADPAVLVSAQGEAREQAFRHFTQGTELMEAIEQGKGSENTLVKALEHAEQATLLDPSAAVYWHLLGHIYARMPEDQMASVMAEDALNKAISLNPANVASRLLLARLLLGRESYALALDHLEWAARKESKVLNAVLAADMCRAYVVDEQAARGEKFFREMRGQHPELSSLRLGLAILLHEQGRKDVALIELQALLKDGKADADDAAYARKLEQVWRGESA